MSEENDITENDIVFECPHCTKSMAIDKRGSGLTISCPDCAELVRVPYLPGEEPEEDEDGEASEKTVEGLSDRLKLSESKITQLATNMSDLTEQRRELERLRKEQQDLLKKMRTEFMAIQSSLDRVSFALEESDSAPESKKKS